jgi:hypothetical protein
MSQQEIDDYVTKSLGNQVDSLTIDLKKANDCITKLKDRINTQKTLIIEMSDVKDDWDTAHQTLDEAHVSRTDPGMDGPEGPGSVLSLTGRIMDLIERKARLANERCEELRGELRTLRYDQTEAIHLLEPWLDDPNCPSVAMSVHNVVQRVKEDNAVCVCGCSNSEHENVSEEGESCEHDDHECIRTCEGVVQIVTGLRKELIRALQIVADGCSCSATMSSFPPYKCSACRARDRLKELGAEPL